MERIYGALLAARSEITCAYFGVVHDASTPSVELSPPILGVLLVIADCANFQPPSPRQSSPLPLPHRTRRQRPPGNNATASHMHLLSSPYRPIAVACCSLKHPQDHVGSSLSFSSHVGLRRLVSAPLIAASFPYCNPPFDAFKASQVSSGMWALPCTAHCLMPPDADCHFRLPLPISFVADDAPPNR